MTDENREYHVQIDGEGSDRVKSDGRRRLRLTALERKAINKMKLASKALLIIIEKSAKLPAVAEELGVSQDLLARTSIDDLELRKVIIKQAVDMFLDLDRGHSRKQMADELGLTIWQLKLLLDTDEFADIYDDHFGELINDPTLRAVQSKLVEDMLPKAIRAMDEILTDKKGPASVRLKAALETLRLAGVQASSPVASERSELTDFLNRHNIVQVNVGEGEKVEVIDGEIKDMSSG